MMLAVEDRALTVAQAARIILDAMKDKTYQATPVGTMVARYMRWLRNEYGATPATVRDYEAILARMAVTLTDREPYQVQTDDLREVIDLWAGRTNRTRQKVTSVIRSFWAWMEEQGHIALSPAARIRRPRAEKKVARVLPLTAKPQLLTQAKQPRDRLALFCLLGLGLRKSELAGIRVRDFDPGRCLLRVYGKGQKERLLPLRGPILTELRLYLASDLPHLSRPPEGDDYLLYPVDRRAGGKGPELEIRWQLVARPKRRMSGASVHRWWYEQAANAGLVAPGVTRDLNMHQARHLFAVELRRVAGIEAASHALGHSDLSTTLGIYGHFDMTDLEQAMDRYASLAEPIVSPDEEA